MSKIYRWQAQSRIGGGEPVSVNYCIRNAAGEYLTHALDIQHGTSRVFFTPSPWMAYTFPDRDMAEMVAAAPDVQGTVDAWEPPATSKRAR